MIRGESRGKVRGQSNGWGLEEATKRPAGDGPQRIKLARCPPKAGFVAGIYIKKIFYNFSMNFF